MLLCTTKYDANHLQVSKDKIVKSTRIYVHLQNNLQQALHHKPKAKKNKTKKGTKDMRLKN
jgi:hypothetical protein